MDSADSNTEGTGSGMEEIKLRALVVDDEDNVRRTIRRVLAFHGFEVDAVSAGATALTHLAATSYDVVLSDISMPVMDGIGLLRAIREQNTELPVILITGKPSLETAKQAVRFGAYQYLEKPFQNDDLVELATEAAEANRTARLKRAALDSVYREQQEAQALAELEPRFRTALEQIWMAYQPIVSAESGLVYGYETLLRSAYPGLPQVGDVLEAAECLGTLDQLGRRIRRLAPQPWLEGDCSELLFINLHPRDLMDDDLLAPESPLVAMADRVVLEITERASLDRIPNAIATVERLRERGFRIAIDDLGAGYSGLTAFASLRPEIVKIDMGLVRDVDSSMVKQKLIQSLAAVSADLGMLVVCEGIETPAERDMVVSLGADLLQGYLIGRPGPELKAP